jgi:signal transduction histidine kinase
MLSYSQLGVQAAYRWIYGVLIFIFVLFNTDQIFVAQASPNQVLLAVTIFIIQYFVFNILFTSWIAMKRYNTTITLLGLLLDITLITGLNFIFGADRVDLLLFYLIPLFFSVPHKNLNLGVYIISLFSLLGIFYIKNGSQLFFTMEILRYALLSLSLYTVFFLIIKYVVHNTYLEAIRKIALLFHEIRNALTVILGYINVLNSEKVTEEQRQFFYRSIESSTLRIKSVCDEYITQKAVPEQEQVQPKGE